MRYISQLFALLFCVTTIISCRTETGKPSGIIKSKIFTVSNYDQIDINANLQVIYEAKPEAEPYLKIEGDENLIAHIQVQVEDNTLKLTKTADHMPTNVIVFTNSTSLKNISLNDGADLHLKGKIGGNQLYLEQDGNANLKADSLSFARIEIVIKGNANAIISGQSANANYSLIGTGAISAKDMIVEELNCHLTGSGYMVVNAQKTLNVNIKGNGTVEYVNYPQILNNVIEGVGIVQAIDD